MSDEYTPEVPVLTTDEKIDLLFFALSAMASSIQAADRQSAMVLAGVAHTLPAPSIETLRKLDKIASASQAALLAGMRKEMPEMFPTNPNAS
jgi:hypothetical protein